MGARRNKAQRLGAAVAALMGGLLLMTSVASSQTTAAPAFGNGTASASAQAVKVNPTAAALSIGVTFGISLAGYTNEVAKAESRGIDLGIIGTTLAGEPCDGGEPSFAAERQPQPLAVDSREPDAAAGKTAPETFDGQTLPVFQKFARATPEPLGEATTLSVPLGQAGALEIAGARTNSITRVVDKKTREAVATVEIGSLILGGGAVRLANLKWEAIHRTGAETTKTSIFSIGSVVIGGVPLPIPAGDPAAVFAVLNPVLATMGIELRPPVSRDVNGAIAIDPLTVAVVPSATRDSIAGQLFNTIQPVREAVVDALLALDCGNDTYVTVADIAIGSMTGAGSFSLELGGAQAFTGDVQLTSLLGGLGGPNLIPGTADEIIPGELGTEIAPSDLAAPPSGVAGPRAQRGDGREVAAPIAATTGGSRGGKLAMLAGGVLLLLAAVAELDRRKMVAAMQTSPPSEA